VTHPGGGFKVADAYADFHIDVDSEIGRAAARLKAKGAEFARMGENAGKAFSAGFAKGVDLDKGMTKNVEALRKRTNQLQRMGNQAGEGYGRGFAGGVNLRGAMVEQLAVVKSARPAFAREGKQAGDAYARGFGGQRISGPSIGGSGGAEASGEQAARGYARGFNRGGKDVETSLAKVADRSQAKFKAVLFGGLAGGLPAAAAAGSAIGAAVTGGAAAGFIALGVLAASQSDKVAKAWLPVLRHVTDSTSDLSVIMEDDLVRAAGTVQKAFDRSMPLIARGVSEAAAYTDTFVTSLTTAGEEALPGLVHATIAARPAIDALGNVVERTGAGANDMLRNIAKGAPAAAAGLREFGGMTRDLLGFTGQLVTNLAENHAELGVLNGALNVTERTLLNATASGSGFVGFLHGFGQAGSGAVGVAGGLLSALSALPPQVTQIGGSFAASSMIMQKFGIDATAGFDGYIGRVRAAEGATAKFKAAGQGLITGAFNPAAIATVGLSILLGELGQRQQEAAQKAQAHQEAVRLLTDALREDGGVAGDVTRQTVAKALADKDAAGNARALGVSMSTVQAAALGNSVALDALAGRNENMIDSWRRSGALTESQAAGLQKNFDWLMKNGGAANTVVNDWGNLSEAQRNALFAAENLTGAIGDQIAQAAQAKTAYEAQETGLNNLTTGMLRNRDAALEAYNATLTLNNAQLGLRGAVMNTTEATDTYNKVLGDSKSTAKDKEKALYDLERAQQAEINAAYQSGVANSSAATDTQKAADGMRSANIEAVKLATSFAGPLPASLAQTISKMSVTEAQAVGLKVGVNKLGQSVYELPGGKQVVLTGDNRQAQDAISAISRQLAALHDKTVYVTIAQRGKSPTGISPTGAPVYSAEGNLLSPRGGDGATHPVRFFAGGGLASLNPMPANRASFVAPNTWRVVGDNMRFSELFAPLNGSKRTADLIMQAAEHEGLLSAATEALSYARTGNLHDDFSAAGSSGNLDRYNDQIAQLYYAQTHQNWGANHDTWASVNSWLQGYVAQQAAAVKAIPAAVASAVKALPPSAPITVTPPPTMDYDLLAEILARKIFLRGR
jgi:hypothetical protein